MFLGLDDGHLALLGFAALCRFAALGALRGPRGGAQASNLRRARAKPGRRKARATNQKRAAHDGAAPGRTPWGTPWPRRGGRRRRGRDRLLAGLFGIGGGAVIVPVLYEVFRAIGVPEALRMQLCIGTSLAIIVPTVLRSYRAHRAREAVIYRGAARLGRAGRCRGRDRFGPGRLRPAGPVQGGVRGDCRADSPRSCCSGARAGCSAAICPAAAAMTRLRLLQSGSVRR